MLSFRVVDRDYPYEFREACAGDLRLRPGGIASRGGVRAGRAPTDRVVRFSFSPSNTHHTAFAIVFRPVGASRWLTRKVPAGAQRVAALHSGARPLQFRRAGGGCRAALIVSLRHLANRASFTVNCTLIPPVVALWR